MGVFDRGVFDMNVFDPFPAALTQTHTDPLGETDSVTRLRGRTTTNTLGLIDTPLRSFARPSTDTVGLTDAALRSRSRLTTDPLGSTDAALRFFARTTTDLLGSTDSASRASVRVSSDALGLSDAALRAFTRTSLDPIGGSDLVVRSRLREVTDGLSATDSGLRKTARLVGDALSSVDTYTSVHLFVKNVTEALNIGDSYDTAAAGQIHKTCSNSLAGLDSLNRVISYHPTVTDISGLADMAVRGTERFAIDPVGITDVAVRRVMRAALDSLTGVDVSTRGIYHVSTDSATLLDSYLYQRGTQRTTTDTLALNDNQSHIIFLVRVHSDIVSLSEVYHAHTGFISGVSVIRPILVVVITPIPESAVKLENAAEAEVVLEEAPQAMVTA